MPCPCFTDVAISVLTTPLISPATKKGDRMKFLALLASMFLAFTASAATPYRMDSIMLLQPEFVLKERVPSVDSLSGYIRAVQGAAASALANESAHPASGHLVLAVRPGKQSMVWLDFKPALPEATAARLRAAILAVPAFEARQGVVVFSLSSSLWGASSANGFPDPPEWRKTMEGHDGPIEIGDLVEKVWPAD